MAETSGTGMAGEAKSTAPLDTRTMTPRVDVLEDEEGITLLADLPGVSKDQLEIKVEGDALVIEGSMAPTVLKGLEPVYAEVRLSRYRRSYTLSHELDPSHIVAALKDGVLNVRIPKQASAQPRRISVSVS